MLRNIQQKRLSRCKGSNEGERKKDMLVLSRKPGDSIVIDGRINIHVIKADKEVVKIGVEAARNIPVFRKEIYDEIKVVNKESINTEEVKVETISSTVLAN
jgi:carbon storage regulator